MQMAGTPLTRRAFSKFLAGSLATGGAILEAAVRENQDTGGVSDETIATLLAHIGYELETDDELRELRPMVEQTLKDIQTIRAFEVPLTLEPSFVFFPDR